MENLYNFIIKKNFYSFFKKTIFSLNQGLEANDYWYLQYLADIFNSIHTVEEKYIIINIPPRFFKSSLISVAWPLWMLGNKPETRIIVSTYAQKLSNKFAADSKILLAEDWFKKIFPDFAIQKGSNDKSKFVTTKNGFRLSTSTGGTITGEGGDFLILDDPHHPREFFSRNLRNKTISWFRQVFSTRLNNHRTGKIIIIMQRLHQDDLTGYLLKANRNLKHINLPAIFQDKKIFSFNGKVVECERHSLLAPDRFSHEELEEVKKEVGNYAFAAQYLGNPVITGGNLIRTSCLRFANINIEKGDLIIHSWDTALCASSTSDFSAVTSWIIRGEQLLLYDYKQLKLEFTELKAAIKSYYKQQSPQIILIEAKASGIPLIDEMKRIDMPVIGITPKLDKITRMIAASFYFDNGKIMLNNRLKTDAIFMEELLSFPKTQHDDIVDSISQFLNWHSANRTTTHNRFVV